MIIAGSSALITRLWNDVPTIVFRSSEESSFSGRLLTSLPWESDKELDKESDKESDKDLSMDR